MVRGTAAGGAAEPREGKAPAAALKRRPAPSGRVPQTATRYHICLRVAGAWLAVLTGLLALVLTVRWRG